MTIQALLERCLAMPFAYADTPFDPEPICVRIGKRIFAEIYFTRAWVTLRCEPQQGLQWRARFPDHVKRGYHCPPSQQPYANTVVLDGAIPDEALLTMLEQSYARVLRAMSRAERASVLSSVPEG